MTYAKESKAAICQVKRFGEWPLANNQSLPFSPLTNDPFAHGNYQKNCIRSPSKEYSING